MFPVKAIKENIAGVEQEKGITLFSQSGNYCGSSGQTAQLVGLSAAWLQLSQKVGRIEHL